jgi:hypothetical protein
MENDTARFILKIFGNIMKAFGIYSEFHLEEKRKKK